MEPLKTTGRSRMMTALLGCATLVLTVLIISHPDAAFEASLGGLRLWWTVLVPGLLPYYILIEIATGFGLLRGIGSLFEPLLRIVLHAPRGSGEVLASGLMNGYPYGAETVLRLTEREQLGQAASTRLLMLAHLGNPALMVTIIGAGFLHSIRAGMFIALVHYFSAFAAALLLPGKRKAYAVANNASVNSNVQSTAASNQRINRQTDRRAGAGFIRSMQQAREEDGRIFGKLLGEAVSKAVQMLFTMSGFIILFAVLCRMLSLLLPPTFPGLSWLPGLLEPHLGSYAAAVQSENGLRLYAIIGATLAWSGLTQHVQVGGLLSGKGNHFRYLPFLLGRFLHAGFAYVLTYAIGLPLAGWLGVARSTTAPLAGSSLAASSPAANAATPASLWPELGALTAHSVTFLILAMSVLALLAALLLPMIRLRRKHSGHFHH